MAKRNGNGPALTTAREALREAIPQAARALVGLLTHKNPNVRLRAALAILNRAGVVEASAVSAECAAYEVGGKPDRLRDSIAALSPFGA